MSVNGSIVAATAGRRRVRPSVAWAALALVSFAAAQGAGSAMPAGYEVIVHASNSIDTLSREQATAYFLKRRAVWPGGSAVKPVDLAPESEARKLFSLDVLRRSPLSVSAYWLQEIFAGRSEPPPVKASDHEVILFVSSTPGAIGYVRRGTIQAGVHSITIVP